VKGEPGEEGLKSLPVILESEGLRFAPIGKEDLGEVFVLGHVDAHNHSWIIDAFGFW
jgi:hypothetical protein